MGGRRRAAIWLLLSAMLLIAGVAVLLHNIEHARRLENLSDSGARVEATVVGLGGAYHGKVPRLVRVKVEWEVGEGRTYTTWVRIASSTNDVIGSRLMLFYDPDDPGLARPVAGFSRRREERLSQPLLLFVLAGICAAFAARSWVPGRPA